MADYFPRRDDDLLALMENLAAKIGGYQALFGLTAAEVAAVNADLAMFRYLMQCLGRMRPDLQEWTAYKDQVRDGPLGAEGGSVPAAPVLEAPPPAVPPGIVPRLRRLVQRIKNHPTYTPAIGADLGILTPDPSPPDDTVKPRFQLTARPNSEVRIDWVKGRLTGVRVESQRGEETAWTFLDIDLQSPYADRRPPLTPGQPEVRRYRLRYLRGDNPIGDYSDVMTVTTVP